MANNEDDSKKLLKIGAVVLIGGLAIALLAMNLLGGGREIRDQKWMLDLESGVLVSRPINTPSPASQGGAGTRSYPQVGEGSSLVDVTLLTSGDPGDIEDGMSVGDLAGVDARVGWVSIHPDGEATGGNELISDASGSTWGPKLSPSNIAMMEAAAAGPGGEPMRVVAGP